MIFNLLLIVIFTLGLDLMHNSSKALLQGVCCQIFRQGFYAVINSNNIHTNTRSVFYKNKPKEIKLQSLNRKQTRDRQTQSIISCTYGVQTVRLLPNLESQTNFGGVGQLTPGKYIVFMTPSNHGTSMTDSFCFNMLHICIFFS